MASVTVNNNELRRLYVLEKKSLPDVAMATGLAISTARRALLKAGITLRSRADGVRAARDKLGKGMLGRKRVFTTAWKNNIRAARIAHGERHAKGVSRKPSGYIEITRGEHKGRRLHDVLMEEKIGRRLLSCEVVHHIDENRSNNEISNLLLMTRAAHTRHHRTKIIGGQNGER